MQTSRILFDFQRHFNADQQGNREQYARQPFAIESISMTSLRFAEKFFFPFRIKRFGAYIWNLSAES
jgi:hypothetical protein